METRKLTKQEMVKGLNLLCASKPGCPELNEVNYEVYYRVLGEIDSGTYEAVILDFMKNGSRYFPTAGEILQAVRRIEKSGEPTAEESWSMIISTIETNSSALHDKKTEYVLRQVGGLDRVKNANIETSLPHIKREFIKIYNETDGKQKDRTMLKEINPKRLISGAVMLGHEPKNGIERVICNLKVILDEAEFLDNDRC